VATPDSEIELKLLDLVDGSQRARVRSLLTSKRGRKKFLDTLYHHPPFDDRYVTVLTHEASFPETICAELVARAAPEQCYVISTNSGLDGTTMELGDALDEVWLHDYGTILLCIPGRLAYYEGEQVIGGGYQLIRRAPQIGPARGCRELLESRMGIPLASHLRGSRRILVGLHRPRSDAGRGRTRVSLLGPNAGQPTRQVMTPPKQAGLTSDCDIVGRRRGAEARRPPGASRPAC
jgi:hypothetical protein